MVAAAAGGGGGGCGTAAAARRRQRQEEGAALFPHTVGAGGEATLRWRREAGGVTRLAPPSSRMEAER